MTTSSSAHREDRRSRRALLSEADVLVVGAGIVGLGHALAAHEAGLRVVVIEREHRVVGASVRNFGHACVTGQAGECAELAQSAREAWLRAASRAGFFAAETGGLALAQTEREAAVLEELSGRRDGQVRMLTGAQARERLGAPGPEGLIAGAWLREDLRVDPREAVPALAAWLAEQDGVEILWNTSFLTEEDGLVQTSRGRIRAQRVVLCVGHDLDHLEPEAARSAGIQRCALQMVLAEDPGIRVEPAVLTGTSMLRYDAFSETDAARDLRAELARRVPELLEIDANLMLTQRPDGTLLIGDSHELAPSQEPFLREATSETLLCAAADALGLGRSALRPVQRWQGVYAAGTQGRYLRARISDRAEACTVTSGVGMTIGLGLGRRAFR
ncbi:TIGR03364 family FAD-dependent oxidoreductase [Rothia halotolerans]|uniref:TIGR03364 family FAD-dependent oxidoreductase n=1 Tax=Rothia halotolerans TaxID=405770 RepID=UPI00101C13DC|nr:TIGR03364 family FAD-dependent oxidoreductase [Rothia halotolerans]